MHRRVLVVDDERNIRLLLRRCLEQSGYEVEEAADGDAAYLAVQREVPALIILDLFMPGTNGVQLLRKLRNGSTRPQVIVLTAQGEGIAAVEALMLGAHEVISKPIAPQTLREAVARVLLAEAPKAGG
jgi:DNA-binding response OmpR family regulator